MTGFTRLTAIDKKNTLIDRKVKNVKEKVVW